MHAEVGASPRTKTRDLVALDQGGAHGKMEPEVVLTYSNEKQG